MSMVTTLLLSSCLTGAAPLEEVRLSLELPSFAGQKCSILLHENLTNNWQGVSVADGRLTDDGLLELSFDAQAGEIVRVSMGRTFRRLWIVPGELKITRNGNAWAYAGAGEVENTLLETLVLNMPVSSLFGEFDFTARYDDLMARRDRALTRIAEHLGDRDDIFRQHVEAEVHARVINSLANELSFARRADGFDEDSLPVEAVTFSDALPLFDDAVGTTSARYRQALGHKLGNAAQHAGFDPSVDRDAWALATLDVYAQRLAGRPRTHEALAVSLLDFMTQYCGPDATSRALDNFVQRFPTSSSLETLSKAHARTIGLNGEDLATIAFVDVNGEPRSLTELHGRRVYIDFWGSWCKACMVQTPQLRELHDNLNSEDAVILGINMHEGADVWRRAVGEKTLPGLQWKPATLDEEARLTELVQLRAYPRFVILSDDGAVLSPTAPPPQDAGPLLTSSR